MKANFVCVGIVALAASAATAQPNPNDRYPPSWRTQPPGWGTLVADWKFETSLALTPYYTFGPGPQSGRPHELINPLMMSWNNGSWYNNQPTPQTMYFWVGDFNAPGNPEKDIRFQVTFSGPAPTLDQVYGFDVGTPGASPNFPFGERVGSRVSEAGYWYENWVLRPNPLSCEEFFLIVPPGGAIDEVIIDTICVPQPSSLAILGLAGWLSCSRRRRM